LFVLVFAGIYAFVVMKDTVTKTDEEIAVELRAMVKQKVSSFAQPDVIVVGPVFNYRARHYIHENKLKPTLPVLFFHQILCLTTC